jgi:hypothetical protein
MEIDTHDIGSDEGTDITVILLALLAGIAIGVVALWSIETADAQQRMANGAVRPIAERRNGTRPPVTTAEPDDVPFYRPPADLEVTRDAQSSG